MSLLVEAPRQNGNGGPPLLEDTSPLENAGAAIATAEVGYDLIAEALRVDSLITAARFQRDEANRRGMPTFQAELHQRQFDIFVGSLAAYGIGPEVIPEASLKYSGPKQEHGKPSFSEDTGHDDGPHHSPEYEIQKQAVYA